MTRRLIPLTALALTFAAGAFVATPAAADNVGFAVSINAPGVSFAVGTPAYGYPAYGGAAYVAPRPAYGYGPYRPYYKPWYRPYRPVVYRPPVVVAPRPIVYAAPYARPYAAPYGGY